MNKKTPQEKKEESYEKDRRSTYGNNAKAARKAVPARKRQRSQAELAKSLRASGKRRHLDHAA